MKKTPERILSASLALFNEKGVVNVRLQHIADACNISLGNLAYHFFSKEAIVQTLIHRIWKEQRQLLANYRGVPLFEHIDYILEKKFALQNTYVFFYSDTLEVFRVYPKTKAHSQEQIRWQIMQFEDMFRFNVARGSFLPDKDYTLLARLFWQEGHLWIYSRRIRGMSLEEILTFKNDMWSILSPCFTASGQKEYERLQLRDLFLVKNTKP